MLSRGVVISVFSIGMLATGVVYGQNYPNKAVRIVLAPVGGGSDFVARFIAPGLSERLKQPVVMENRPSGVIPGEIVSKALPDGYTLLLSGSSLWLSPFMEDKVPFDPVRDFSPITLTANTPNILVVHPTVSANSVKDLIALAKAKAGELNYSSGPSGTPNHIAGELFKSMAGINIVRISYKGSGPALTAVVGGQVQLMFVPAASVATFVKAGKLKALAVTSAQPSALAPGLPTVAASGLPGYEVGSIYGVFAPAKTPVTIIHRLNREIVDVVNRVDVKEKFLNFGAETVGSSPEALAVKMKSEMIRLGKVIKDARISGD